MELIFRTFRRLGLTCHVGRGGSKLKREAMSFRHMSIFSRRLAIFFLVGSTFFWTAGKIQYFSANTKIFRSGSIFFRSFSERGQMTGPILVKSGFGARAIFFAVRAERCLEDAGSPSASDVPSQAAGRLPPCEIQISVFPKNIFLERFKSFPKNPVSEQRFQNQSKYDK